MTRQETQLREAITRLHAATAADNPNPWAQPAFLGAVADLLEREADSLADIPYPVSSDWIERNYVYPLAVARAYLGGQP